MYLPVGMHDQAIGLPDQVVSRKGARKHQRRASGAEWQ